QYWRDPATHILYVKRRLREHLRGGGGEDGLGAEPRHPRVGLGGPHRGETGGGAGPSQPHRDPYASAGKPLEADRGHPERLAPDLGATDVEQEVAAVGAPAPAAAPLVEEGGGAKRLARP